MAVLESTSLSRKLQALAMVRLMIATTLCFADNNTTVLNAYIRHAVVASQDLNSMIADKAGTVSEQARLAEHFIRGGSIFLF